MVKERMPARKVREREGRLKKRGEILSLENTGRNWREKKGGRDSQREKTTIIITSINSKLKMYDRRTLTVVECQN